MSLCFAPVETERLLLRRMEPGDLRDLFELRSEPSLHAHTDTKPDASTEDTAAYIARMNRGIDEGRWAVWAMAHKASRRVVGTLCVWNHDAAENSAELGCGIAAEYRGRGLMAEALRAAAEYAFHAMGLAVLRAYTEESNIAAARLLERCGFVRAGHMGEAGCVTERVYSMDIYEKRR
jgi:ribosomal-protein-alanine N-acetyltransferase